MKAGISKGKRIVILAIVAIILVALAFLAIKLSNLQVLKVEGRDMEPTLHQGDRILVTREPRRFQRGDIVIFNYPADPSKRLIKRIVGLPNEVLEIKVGKVFINGNALEENYVDAQSNQYSLNKEALRIPEDSYYVLGDNRDNSNDSRFWGPLSTKFIDGMVG